MSFVGVDDQQVGELKKYGHSGDFEVTPGVHVLTVKAFGGVRGDVELEFSEGQTLDLVCGYGSYASAMGSGQLRFWERDAE
jgi:hypothetical protein